jgi:hypothetical protein
MRDLQCCAGQDLLGAVANAHPLAFLNDVGLQPFHQGGVLLTMLEYEVGYGRQRVFQALEAGFHN